MRLTAYIQSNHQISRRAFVDMIKHGYVLVNTKKVESYAEEVTSGDIVEITTPNFKLKDTVKGEKTSSTIILLNKPKGYVTSKSDPHNETIYDILPPEFKKYYYI